MAGPRKMCVVCVGSILCHWYNIAMLAILISQPPPPPISPVGLSVFLFMKKKIRSRERKHY